MGIRMCKFTRFFAALAAAVSLASAPQEASARPVSVTADYPAVPRYRTNSLPCYMRTQKGVTLDLGRLCGGNNTQATGTISADAWRAASLPGGIIQRRVPSTLGGYAVIAFSPATKRFSAIGPRLTRFEALAQAKKLCGRKDCQIGLSFRNTCGAFALKGNKPTYALGASETLASKAALLKTGKGGKVVVSLCSRQSPSLL